MIGVVLTPMSNPAEAIISLKRRALSHRRSTSSVEASRMSTRRQAGRHVGRGERRGEEEGAGPLTEPLGQGGGAGHVPAHDAEGLGQRAHLDVDPAVQPEVVDDAPPAPAEHSLAVGVVHHDQGLVGLGDGDDGVERGDVAVHGEDAVGDDQDATAPRRREPR